MQTSPAHNEIAKCQLSGCFPATSTMLILNCRFRATAKDAGMLRGYVKGKQNKKKCGVYNRNVALSWHSYAFM